MAGRSLDVILPVSDGSTMNAYISFPDGGAASFPGLLLFQEAYGVNHHIRSVADRFAGQGYLVIAPELFHRTAPAGFSGDYSNFNGVASHMQALTNEGLTADIQAAYNWLNDAAEWERGNIGSVGYCMGGRVSFLANTILPLRAAVSYYGGRIVPDLVKRTPSLHGEMLFFWGGKDQHIPHQQVEEILMEMKNAGKQYINVEISDADHAFFCDERPAYHPVAAKQSWVLTLEFLASKLKTSF